MFFEQVQNNVEICINHFDTTQTTARTVLMITDIKDFLQDLQDDIVQQRT
jgi:hypothetical protein